MNSGLQNLKKERLCQSQALTAKTLIHVTLKNMVAERQNQQGGIILMAYSFA